MSLSSASTPARRSLMNACSSRMGLFLARFQRRHTALPRRARLQRCERRRRRIGRINDHLQAELLKQAKNAPELDCGFAAFYIASEYGADACEGCGIVQAKTLGLSRSSHHKAQVS